PRTPVFTTETGGIIDDLMVANFGDHLFLVVNAAGKAGDVAHLRTHLSDVCDVDVPEERVPVALQGPLAEDALAKMSPTTVAMRFMDAGCHVVAGAPCLAKRRLRHDQDNKFVDRAELCGSAVAGGRKSDLGQNFQGD